jgi:TonB family protein
MGSAEEVGDAAFVEEPPKKLVEFPPEYPPELRADGIEGRVTFRVVLDTAGVPELSTFRIVSSPSVELSDAVRVAVAQWRYAPARVNGRAVRVMIEQWIDFHARKRARNRLPPS